MIRKFATRFLGEAAPDVLERLLSPERHSLLVHQRRARLMISRVRLIALMFAVLTPTWILIDLALFPWPLWGCLAALRGAATVGFAGVPWVFRKSENIGRALFSLAALQLIPTVFFWHPSMSLMFMRRPVRWRKQRRQAISFCPISWWRVLPSFPTPPRFLFLSLFQGHSSIMKRAHWRNSARRES